MLFLTWTLPAMLVFVASVTETVTVLCAAHATLPANIKATAQATTSHSRVVNFTQLLMIYSPFRPLDFLIRETTATRGSWRQASLDV